MVGWHEEDDPSAVELDNDVTIAQATTRVLELKVPVPTRWSSLFYMIERCTTVAVLWDLFKYGIFLIVWYCISL